MKTLCVLAIALLCISIAAAEETFFSALESQAEVEKEGGTVDGGSFAPREIWQRVCQRRGRRCHPLSGGRPVR